MGALSLWTGDPGSRHQGDVPVSENHDGFQLISCLHQRIPKDRFIDFFSKILKSIHKSEHLSRASNYVPWFIVSGSGTCEMNKSCVSSIRHPGWM
jgi:hypothetical protein